MAENLSVIEPHGASNSTCGYCSPQGSRSATKSNFQESAIVAYELTCDVYQRMIDRGWRRSGTYCYKPLLSLSCCPQYTIKLDACAFAPSKSQRKLLNRWNRYVLEGDTNEKESKMNIDNVRDRCIHAVPSKPPSQPTSLETLIHASEQGFTKDITPRHTFQVTLEPSSYTSEKFALFKSYEANIHKSLNKTPGSFDSFLVKSPLTYVPVPYTSTPPDHLPKTFGSYHQLYRLDGKLIMLNTIDVLPACVSSVYCIWDKEFEKYSLGKLSALREASLAREIHQAGVTSMRYLYMGFYIYTCPKMRYKGEYSPSYLADPEGCAWHPLENCNALLDKHRYACFTHPEHSVVNMPDPNEG
ncbi:arginine-tRNA-protein transferase [Amylostereum chailletii]|nr:arginine-tRNA-protein transferase [Amylostereum chailletii]